MNDSTNLRDLPTPTTRFCPECAAKVRAVPSRFDQPVQCPNCKALVFFWDLRTETLQATKSLDWIDHHIRIGWLAPACYMFAGLAGFALLLFLLGLVIFPIVLCVLLACVGLTAFGYTLTHLGELKLIRDHRLKLDGSILDVRAKQREIAVKYEVSQKHLQDIIKEDQQKLEMICKRRLYEVDERETKLKSLEEMLVADAQQKIGLSSETLAILASKYLDDMQKWLVTKLTTQNLNQSRERFLKLVAFFEKSGYSVSKHEIDST